MKNINAFFSILERCLKIHGYWRGEDTEKERNREQQELERASVSRRGCPKPFELGMKVS